ncbi:MAG: hypothetical protein RIS64_3292, partial [Bacteroidota bacterium]
MAQTVRCTTLARTNCGQLTAIGGLGTINTFCEGQEVYFSNNSDNTVDSTLYCWGDGRDTMLFRTTPGAHTYQVGEVCLSPDDLFLKQFEIKMIVFKKCGTTYSAHYLTTPVFIRVKPKVEFLVRDTVCAETDVPFTNKSCMNDSSNYVSVLWDFGDGTTSTSGAESFT